MASTSYWDHIPDDLALLILLHSSPIDIVSLRLVSKRFWTLSRDFILWRAVYKQSPLLLPKLPIQELLVHEIDQLLCRSQRFHNCWDYPICHPKTIHRLTCPVTIIQHTKIALHRYLFLAQHSRFWIYDLALHSESPTISYEDESLDIPWGINGSSYQCSEVYENGSWGLYIVRTTIRVPEDDQITIYRCFPSEPDQQISKLSLIIPAVGPMGIRLITLRDEFIVYIHPNKAGRFIYNLRTQEHHFIETRLPVDSSFVQDINAVSSSTHIVLILGDQDHNKTSFEAYPLKDLSEPSELPLQPSHYGNTDFLCPPGVLVHERSTSGSSYPNALEILSIGSSPPTASLLIMRLHLLPGGRIIESLEDLDISDGSNAWQFISHCFIHSSGKGVSRSIGLPVISRVTGQPYLQGYQIRRKEDGRLSLQICKFLLGDLDYDSQVYAFDGFAGRICLRSDTDILVLEYT
ncbi:hypothetical protein BDN72DRAFT_955054 [Pluteus cervinus]|uniref:Uncharacterized protein n=1 Tax=Pluteus cervinus TaxID=181527 RepID=A0ACD3BC70_9AGAR|nr:hypothetical protein BDN72DRAFT_955054 [Pluteus cervinus]